MLIQPKLDPKAASQAMKDAKDLHRKMTAMKVDWKDISKHSLSSIRSIKGVSTAASQFTKELSSAARSSFKKLSELGKQLEDARKKAEDLKKKYNDAKSPTEKKAVQGKLSGAKKDILGLEKQFVDLRKGNKQYLGELQNVIKAQKQYQDTLKKAAGYTGKNFSKEMIGAIHKARSGGVRGAISGIGQSVSAGSKYAKGVAARATISSGGEMGAMSSAITGLSKAVPVLAGAVTAMTALWQLIKAASEHQTKLNKAMLEGLGTAGDFTTATETYRDTVDELRVAARDSAGEFLKLGGDSEQALKVVNRFAVESTGSLLKTRSTLAELGKGDVQAGMALLAKNAIAYGKAMNMEATEVGTMMGQLQSDAGYGAEQIQNVMGMAVKAAASANMPMTKFMGIFRQVLPDVELYQNRLEELTGTIKLLSKTMSPKDVKNFMDSFTNGFKGMDFKQRLKVALVAGTGFVSKTLDKDFSLKAKTMAENFSKYGINSDEFEKAYKGGEKSMAELIAKAQGRAAEQGEQLSGTVITNAMKLASYESARQKGGPLNTATAMRGGGMFATYKIMEKFSQTFVKGFDGLSEHVIKQLGVSEEQYEAMRTMSQSLKAQRAQLQMFGKTNSISMNKSLRSLIAQEKNTEESKVTSEMMAKASDEQLFYAAEQSNVDKKTSLTAEDLAVQQIEATTSVGDKLENIIAYLLEKIYGVLDPILKIIDNVWEWLVGSKKTQESIGKIDKFSSGIQASGYGAAEKGKMKQLADALMTGAKSGASGGQMTKIASGVYDPKMLQANADAIAEKVSKFAESRGSGPQAQYIKDNFLAALKEGNVSDAFGQLAAIPGDIETNLLQFGQNILPQVLSDADKNNASGGPVRRPGAEVKSSFKTKAEYEKFIQAQADAADIDRNMVPLATGRNATATGPAGASKSAGLPPEKNRTISQKAYVEQTEQQTKEVVSSHEKSSDAQIHATEDVYDGINDTLNILKKGIRFESSFLRGPYAGILKSATLDSFREALLEFAIIQAKMQNSPGISKMLSSYGQEIAGGDPAVALRSLFELPSDVDDPNALLKTFRDKNKDYSGSKLIGGPVHDTGSYKLHRGEYVVPAMPAGDKNGGNRPTVHANINIHGTSLTQQQLEGAVYGAMDKLARRP